MIDKIFREEFLLVAIDLMNSPLVSFGPAKGSVSARDFESQLVLITPSGIPFSQLKPEDLIVVDLEGKVIDGILKLSLDAIFHLAVYRARDDVGGVIHTHSPYATAFACLGEPIQPLNMSIVLMVGGSVDVAPFVFPGTRELGESVVKGLGNKNAVLMEQHGVLCVSKNLKRALSVAGVVENVAQIQSIASRLGKLRPLGKATIERGIAFEKNYGQAKK